MQSINNNETRRVFLKKASSISLMAGLSGLGYSGGLSCTNSCSTRRILAEPGPMIPPVPAILLTVKGKQGDPDEISVVWTFVVNGKPPQVGISVDEAHVAGDLIKQSGEFVLNVPTAKIVEAFDRIDMNSSKVADKFNLSGLTRGKAAHVDAPTVVESPIHVECKVFNIIDVPPVRTLFLAEVMATTVQEGACDENGRLMVENMDFFGMTAGSGEFYTMGRPVGHIGMTVGRDDIKY